MNFRGLMQFANAARAKASRWLLSTEPPAQAQLDALLNEALVAQDLQKAREVLALGANPNASLPGGDLPLHRAAKRCGASMALALLDAGAQVDAVSSFGRRALHDALENPNAPTELIEALLSRGACPNALSLDELSPLRVALHFSPAGSIKALLDFGADPNAPLDLAEPMGTIPLAEAARANDLQLAQMLTRAGACAERALARRSGKANPTWAWLESKLESEQLERCSKISAPARKARAL